MTCETDEAVGKLIFFAAQHGDTSGVNACKRILADSVRRFSKGEFEGLKETVERVARLQALKALYDRTPDGETESICDQVDAEEDWLLAQSEIFNEHLRRLLPN